MPKHVIPSTAASSVLLYVAQDSAWLQIDQVFIALHDECAQQTCASVAWHAHALTCTTEAVFASHHV